MTTTQAETTTLETREPMPFEYLDPSKLHPSPFNPRGEDLGDLASLKVSIAERGVIQPLLVRAMPGGFEVVVGHRRRRASMEVGLSLIPCVVSSLSDREAMEAQLAENADRADIHPLDEALALRRLVKDQAVPPSEVAEALGRTTQYVYQRLRLCDLVPEARAMFRKGLLNVTSALYVARVPTAELQKELVKELAKWPELTPGSVLNLVQTKYMLRLEIAPFDTTSETIVPAAGSCARCPKRTGNQRELFTDVKSQDVCTDPKCFKQKAAAAWKGHEALALQRGWKVLGKVDAARLFQRSGHDFIDDGVTPWVPMEGKCLLDPKGRTWKQVIGKGEVQVYLGRDPGMGRIHHLVRRREAVEAGLVNGHSFLQAGTEAKGPDPKAEIRKRVVTRVLDKIYGGVGRSTHAHYVVTLVPVLVRALVEHGAGEALGKRLLAERGEKPGKGKTAWAWLRDNLDTGDDLDSARLLPELVLGRGVYDVQAGYDPALKAVAEVFGVDVKKVEADLRKEAKGEGRAPKRPKGRGK